VADLELIEVQPGSYLGEEGDVRFEDSHGRAYISIMIVYHVTPQVALCLARTPPPSPGIAGFRMTESPFVQCPEIRELLLAHHANNWRLKSA